MQISSALFRFGLRCVAAGGADLIPPVVQHNQKQDAAHDHNDDRASNQIGRIDMRFPLLHILTDYLASVVIDVQSVDLFRLVSRCIRRCIIADGLFPDFCDALRYIQLQQRHTVVQALVTQCRQTVRQFQLFQLCAGVKAMIPQFFHGRRQLRLLHRQAIGKCRALQLRHTLRNDNAFQRGAVIEAVLTDLGDIAQVDLLQNRRADKAPVRQSRTILRHLVRSSILCLRIADQRFAVRGEQYAVLRCIGSVPVCHIQRRQTLTAIKDIAAQFRAGCNL